MTETLTFGVSAQKTPVHCFFHEPEQYRLKVQRFSNLPPEVTVYRASMERDVERYQRAYENGADHCFPKKRGPRVLKETSCEAEDVERSQRRAKSKVRRLVKELVPNHFSTFSTRESGPNYLTAQEWSQIWRDFVRMLRDNGIEFEYVAVLERHPSNPLHLHLHVAWRGSAFVKYNRMRYFWHKAIAKHYGQDVRQLLRGKDAPGNIQDKPIKAKSGSYAHAKKVGKYIGKYITKDLICEFNKKRYWCSRGLKLQEMEVSWLNGLTMAEALREALEMLGLWGEAGPLQRIYSPDDRVAWLEVETSLWPPPA